MKLKLKIILALLTGFQTLSYAQIKVSPASAEMDAIRKSDMGKHISKPCN
jgi:hypothetical protein